MQHPGQRQPVDGHPALRRQAGVTLFECIVALIIIGTSILAGLTLLETRRTVSTDGQLALEAHRFLQRAYEEGHVLGYDGVVADDFAPVPENPDYELRRQVTDLNADTRQVTIEIRWSTATGQLRSESLTTLFCHKQL